MLVTLRQPCAFQHARAAVANRAIARHGPDRLRLPGCGAGPRPIRCGEGTRFLIPGLLDNFPARATAIRTIIPRHAARICATPAQRKRTPVHRCGTCGYRTPPRPVPWPQSRRRRGSLRCSAKNRRRWPAACPHPGIMTSCYNWFAFRRSPDCVAAFLASFWPFAYPPSSPYLAYYAFRFKREGDWGA